MSPRVLDSVHRSIVYRAVLCDFVVDGYLARHLRRMRNLYAERVTTLMEGARQYLGGLLEISIGYLKNEMNSRQAEALAEAQGIEVLAVDDAP